MSSDKQSPSSSTTQVQAGQDVIPPLDLVSPQLTVRAVLTGMILGGLLSVCNIYTGLLIGWGTNMSITGILLAFGLWHGVSLASNRRVKPLHMLENNINQSACSAAAAVSSAGLVAPIPALTMITGQELSWAWMSVWVFAVCLVGIAAAVGLRRQMVVVDNLAFPGGAACATMLKEIHGQGADAIQKIQMMGAAAVVAAAVKVGQIMGVLKSVGFSGLTIKGHSSKALGFELEPNLLMVGVGGLIGLRGCISLMLGAIIGWGIAAPMLINSGHAGLSTSTPLLAPPPELETADKRLKLEHRAARHELRVSGVMDSARREQLLAISPDANFRDAVGKLHTQSQLEIAAPLAALPTGVSFAGLPVTHDANSGKLIVSGALTAEAVVALRAASSEAAWVRAVDELAGWFSYRVTQPLRGSEPLEQWPGDLAVPSQATGVLGFDPARKAVVVKGNVDSQVLAELAERARKLGEAEPAKAQDFIRAFEAASRAAEKAREAVIPGGAIPTSLAGIVSFDATSRTLTAVGPLSPATVKAMEELGADADYRATVSALAAASQYRPARANTGDLLEWLLWPGVVLMVVSSLVSLTFSGPAMLRAFRRGGGSQDVIVDEGDVSRRWFIGGAACALVVATIVQVLLFDVQIWAAVLGVLMSFVLAVVATRVSGETNVTPIGAMGKVTQLVFGVISPGNPAANLMAANVTGGAASQCADLMHDLKCGHLIGAMARKQAISQIAGALAGSLMGSMFYLILIPNPREQLLTEQWPAPAVATWKAVAELFMIGLDAVPRGTPTAMLIAGALGVALPILDRVMPKHLKVLVPSAASMGLALVILPKSAISMLLGAIIAYMLARVFPRWTDRFLVTICAGLVAGESLTGAGDALRLMLFGN